MASVLLDQKNALAIGNRHSYLVATVRTSL